MEIHRQGVQWIVVREGPVPGRVRSGEERRQNKAGWVEGWLKHANQRARSASSLTLSASGRGACAGGVDPGRIVELCTHCKFSCRRIDRGGVDVVTLACRN